MNNTCRTCRYYVNGSNILQCLVSNTISQEREKIKKGLVGKCDDFMEYLEYPDKEQ